MAKNTVAVIGGGPGGMMAAWAAADSGAPVILWEKNRRLGRKMLISGKGRCNVTNNCSVSELVKAMVGNGKFLYGAFSDFSPADAMNWLTQGGVELKTERGNRVFPVSDQASSIVDAMAQRLEDVGVKVELGVDVEKLSIENDSVTGVVIKGRTIPVGAVVVATGGLSYPATGCTGAGYELAAQAGHSIKPLYPALVPLVVREKYVEDLEGLSLRNAEIILKHGSKVLGREFGEMVFTDFGVSGPVILTLSHLAGKHFLSQPQEPLELKINLKPALTSEQLDQRLLRDFDTYPKRNYSTLLQGLLPKKLIPVFVTLSGIDPWKQGHQLNRADRKIILQLLREFPFTVTGCRPLSEAIVTAGGVNIKEIDPKTMASRKTRGLYFAGEVMDVHGLTGGFNIQSALASGYRCGRAAARQLIRG